MQKNDIHKHLEYLSTEKYPEQVYEQNVTASDQVKDQLTRMINIFSDLTEYLKK